MTAAPFLSAAEIAKLRFLLIDDQPVAAQALRICAQTMGAAKIEQTSGFSDAIQRCRARPPDVILCDYMLGEGRTGQQLLEELRRFNLLPDENVFVMVTAEQSYEQVVAAVELVPDEYVLKPFSAELLRQRIERVIQRKRLFADVFAHRRAGRRAAEMQALAALLESHKAYEVEILRQMAEGCLAAGQAAEAAVLYERIRGIFDFPWTRVGLARAHRLRQRYEEARGLLADVTREHPDYFAAQDLMAQVALDLGAADEAQQILDRLAARTPRNFVRKRQLAFAALANDDAGKALEVMEDVIRNDSMPGAVTEEDRLQAARTAIAAGKPELAARVLEGVDLASLPDGERLTRITLAVRGGVADSESRYREHRDWMAATGFEPLATMDLIAAALRMDDAELAFQHAERLLRSGEARQIFRAIFRLFHHAGKDEAFRALQKRVATEKAAAAAASAAADPADLLPA